MSIGWKVIISRRGEDWIIVEPDRTNLAIRELADQPNLYRSRHAVRYSELESDFNCSDFCLCCSQKDISHADTVDVLASRQLAPLTKTKRTNAFALPRGSVNVKEFELGVDISYTAWINRYGSSMAQVDSQMSLLISRLDETWLQSSFVKHVIGTVIVRTNQATDPYQGFGSTSVPMLEAFRNRWNSNPGNENGGTHDLAVLHHGNGGGGFAWVGQVGESFRYGVGGANTTLGWLGFIHHEIGHIWGLVHSHGRQELNFQGNQFGIMWVGPHERATSDESATIISERDESSSGGINIGPASFPVPPYGYRDDYIVPDANTFLFDVLANDYDANGESLTLQMIGATSNDGGVLDISEGTGPDGRDQMVYTPPSNWDGSDYFHYRVEDSTGRWAFGYVTVEINSYVVDLEAMSYRYDLGPGGSQLFDDPNNPYVLLTEFGGEGVTFSPAVNSIDYGGASGANGLNRDGVFRSDGATSVMEHRVVNGLYRVLVTIGDVDQALDDLTLGAEGQTFVTNIDRNAGQFANEVFNVEVHDDALSLQIADAGGSSNRWMATRIIIDRLNSAPVAKDDIYAELDGAFLFVEAEQGLLKNDRELDNEVMTVSTTPVVDAAHGQLQISTDGSFAYVPDSSFNGTDSFVYEVLDPSGLASSALVRIVAQSKTDVVLANSIADLQVFPSNGQDRNEMIVGEANGQRVYIVRFDTSVIAPYLNSDYELVQAEVLLTEQASRDALNGNAIARIESYFLDTVECDFWSYDDIDNLHVLQNGVLPWFGNTQARPGRFGGDNTDGNSNVDTRADIDNSNQGVASGQILFLIGNADHLAIDLTNGSGLTLETIESILADWVAGDNAGLGFTDRDATAQRFFQSGSVAAGNLVNSTIDGQIAGTGVAQAGEAGNGLGGPQLKLIFFNSGLLLGDVNGDGAVNLLDVGPFVELLTNGDYLPAADINGDGVVNLLDVDPFVDLLGGG